MDEIIDTLGLMKTSKGKEIAWTFFLDYYNSTDVSKIVYSHLWRRHQNSQNRGHKKSWTIPYVNKLRNKWGSCSDFFEECYEGMKVGAKNKSTRNKPHTKYKLTLVPFFTYLESKNKLSLSYQEKNILLFLFSPTPVRKKLFKEFREESLLDAIPKFYFKYFYHPFLLRKSGIIKPYNTSISFKKEYFDNLINPKNSRNEDYNKVEGIYLGDNPSFIEKNGKWYSIDYDKDFYVFHYSKFHEYEPDIINILDKKMLKVLNLV